MVINLIREQERDFIKNQIPILLILPMSRLVLLFSLLLSGSLLGKVEGTTLHKGYIVFQVEKQVYELEQLQNKYKQLKVFSCMHPSSLLVKWTRLTNKESGWLTQAKSLPQKLSELQSRVLQKLLRYVKLTHYIDGQQIYMAPNLGRLLKKSSRMNKCKADNVFRGNQMAESLIQIVKLEVLLSQRKKRFSRFQSQKKEESFFSTIEKQIPHQLLW